MPSNKPNTDTLLVQELEKGNEKAFRKLFEMHWETMFFQAKSLVRDEDTAKDIVQNTWTNIWQNKASQKIENFQGYIHRAVRFNCFKHLRDNKLTPTHIEVIEGLQMHDQPEVQKQHDLEGTRAVIQDALDGLSPRCRQIFNLSRFEEVSNEEIASYLGISKRSVENQMSIALKSIRHNLASMHSLALCFVSIFFTS